MTEFILNDIRKFCLCNLDSNIKCIFLNDKYVTKSSRVFVWKILMCNKALNLVDVDYDEYIEELEKSTAYSIPLDSRIKIWNLVEPIYKKIKEYSSLNYKPTDLYLRMSDNGFIKEEIKDILRKSGAHSYTAYILPITEKFWIEADCTFTEFCGRIHDCNIPKEWWDFHQNKKPVICDE